MSLTTPPTATPTPFHPESCKSPFYLFIFNIFHLTCQSGAGAQLGRTMWGMTTLGAFGFQLQEVAGDRRIVTTTRSHSNKVVIDCVDAMEPHEVVRVGGAGNKVRWRTCIAWSWLLNIFYR